MYSTLIEHNEIDIMNVVKLALKIYDDMMYIYHYYWELYPEETSTSKTDLFEFSKKRSYIKIKTHAIIAHDKLLIEGSKK